MQGHSVQEEFGCTCRSTSELALKNNTIKIPFKFLKKKKKTVLTQKPIKIGTLPLARTLTIRPLAEVRGVWSHTELRTCFHVKNVKNEDHRHLLNSRRESCLLGRRVGKLA